MNTKRSITTYAALALTVLMMAVSCQREIAPIEQEGVQIEKGESVLSFSLENPGFDEGTKSVITDPTFESGIKSIMVLVVSSDGHWKRTYSTTVSGLKTLTISADGSTSYTVYAFANMGDVDIPTVSGVIRPDLFAYTLPSSFSGLNSTGLPMAGSAVVPASSVVPNGVTNITVRLNRLLSKVIVKIDKGSMLSGASDGSALAGGSLKVCQVAKVVRPFAAAADRRAQSTSEVYSTANSDYYNFTLTDKNNLVNENIVLYIAENRQGNGSGSTQAGKTPTTGRENLVTYLEYTAAKNGASDGVSGNMTYRVYLGENVTNNFDVIGDKVYSATLNLSWNGMWEGPWRVTSSSWADTRALVISAAANSSNPMITQNTKAGSAKVRKGTPTAFYMNFFPNGTSGSVAHSRKDQSSWPYGWVAYVDGSSVYMSGTSGIIKTPSNENLISWSYNTTTDCLSMETIPGAPASTVIHTLQFKTMDARKESNVVYFTTSIPFEFRWRDSGNPNHVAQRGILEALDADTHVVDAQGVFHVKDGYSSKVRLTDNGDGTAVVELIDGFTAIEDAIYIEDADGDRHCDVPLEARIPYWECTSLWTTYVDASVNLKFTYFTCDDEGAKSSTAMVVTDNGSTTDAITTGAKLDRGLIEEIVGTSGNARLAPALSCDNGKLGFLLSVNEGDGSYNINTYIATYKGLAPSGSYFTVDRANISVPNYTSRGSHATNFIAWNPWKNITNIPEGDILEDYTLYCFPNGYTDSPSNGWMTSGPRYNPPSPAANTSMNIQNPVVAHEGNITFNTLFDQTTRYLGNICSVDPSKPIHKTSADFNPFTCSLIVDITDHSHYDKDKMYAYLYGRGYLFYNKADMDAQLAQYNYSFVIGGNYSSSSAAWADAPSGVTESSPSYIQGTTFRVVSNATDSEWRMIYGMAGKSRSDITTHGAGKINMMMQIHNVHDDSYLEYMVGRAWMRLHIYIWPVVFPPTTYHFMGSTSDPYGSELASADYAFSSSLWAPVDNCLLDFSGMDIAQPQDEIYNGVFIAGTSGLMPGEISKTIPSYIGSGGRVTWAIIGHRVVNSAASLKEFLNSTSSPFTYKSSDVLDPNKYYRENSYLMYCDPSGTGKYSKGTGLDAKLYVLHLAYGPAVEVTNSHIYYYNPAYGF